MRLEQPYDRESFLNFIGEFLPDFSRDTRLVAAVAATFSDTKSLGSSSKLDLQVFEVKVKGSLDKRVAIATDAFRLMKTTASFRTLVAFHSEDTDQWRLSLMTAQPVIENGKVTTQLSNPKRFSYLLGPGSKLNTPSKQLITKGEVSDFEDLAKRFAVEVVNNEFYKEITKLYDELVGTDKAKGVLKYPGQGEVAHEFAVRLIGRIIFCWFLREKKSVAGTPLIPAEILSRTAADEKNYYHSVLAPLFFEALNKHLNSREPKFREGPYESIPYLNGGLFNPDSDDHYKFDKALALSVPGIVDVPDSWLQKFFNLLELYNFTVDENTSYDIDLSIDPEMLGRIFENLLARINPETGETVRKSTGSFYTPREIVEYMVDESLKEYLKEQTDVTEEKLSALVSYDLLDDEANPLDPSEKKQVTEALSKVKILDPACGSGAFPIGILQKIVFILQQVDPDSKLWLEKQLAGASPELKQHLEREFDNKNFDYLRKLGVIRESIYGVDIQPIATEISRLRCFLTLIVDQSVEDNASNRGIEPLPNLDFKFVTANSLIGLDANTTASEQTGLFEDSIGINDLKELRSRYFNSHNSERENLKLQFSQRQNKMLQEMIAHHRHGFADLTQKVSTWNPFEHEGTGWFDPEWMFGISNGFDIVIANPPYFNEKGHKDLFREIAKSPLGEKYYLGKMDIFYFFFHLGLNELRTGGVLSFITTNYYLTATNAKKLRNDFRSRATILSIINLNELKIFESALGQHNAITILKRGNFNLESKTAITNRSSYLKNNEALSKVLSWRDDETEYHKKKQSELYNNNGLLDIRNDPRSNLLEKVSSESDRLGAYFKISEGLQTGNNKVFVFEGRPHFFEKLSSVEKNLFKPFYKNSDIQKFYTDHSTDKFVLYIDANFVPKDCPQIMQYLLENEASLKNRAQIVRSNQPWYTLLWPREKEMFENEKLIFPYRSKGNIFSYSDEPWYSATDTYIIYKPKRNLMLALGILSSEFALAWFRTKGALKGSALELKGDNISSFPIPKMGKPILENKISDISASIVSLKKKGASTSQLEKELNELVFEFYGLKDEEINILKGFRTDVAVLQN